MASIIELKTISDERGMLTFIEKELQFDIKRVFYIYNLTNLVRGGHRHKVTTQAIIALNGSCEIYCDNGTEKKTFLLNSPDKCLIVKPEDWHTMENFFENTILLVLSSHLYDSNDYIIEKY